MDENDILIEDVSAQYKEGVELSLAEKPIGEILVEKGIVKSADIEEVLKDRKTTGEALVEKGKEYVEAAVCLGLSRRRILFGHLLPNCLPPLIVIGTLQVANAISAEATLSFS